VAVLAVNKSLASFTSGGQTGAALTIAGIDIDTSATATHRDRDFIVILHLHGNYVRRCNAHATPSGGRMSSPGARYYDDIRG
jgi:hypothetical protein